MKIAILTNNRPHLGGISTYINNLTKGFNQLGHDVDIITPFGVGKNFKIINEESFKKFDSFFKNRQVLTLLAIYALEILIFYQTLKACLKNKYDFFYPINVTVANAIRPLEKILKLKVILNPISTNHGELLSQGKIKSGGFVAKIIIRQEKKAYKKAKVLVAIANHLAEYFKSLIVAAPPIYVIPCPFDEKIFYLDKKAGKIMRSKLSVENKFVILFVARMVKEKGPFEALEAFNKLAADNDNFSLIFVGDGPLKDEVGQKAKNLSLADKVKILGFVPENEIGAVYNAADVLIMPAFTYRGLKQGQGTVPQEAMACGVPVIVSACGGLTDTVQNEKNGLLIEEQNIDQLVQAILRIKNDGHLGQSLIKQGLIDVNQRYQRCAVAQKIIDVYQKTF
jgi:glycosyltransferase involved in cell wall biosynthesis